MPIRNLIPWHRSGERLPVRRTEDSPLATLHSEMNRLFDDFSRSFGLAPFGWAEGARAFEPDVDIDENDDEIRVSIELPGVEEKDLDVSLRDDVLTVRGEKREERSGKQRGGRWSECRYGSFVREIPLTSEVDSDRAQAAFRLFDSRESQGALNLYATEVGAFEDLGGTAALFKHQAAVAISYAREVTNLKEALATRKTIGQAMGIVMERYQLTEERAFQFLVRASSTSNIRLRAIAQEIVDSTNEQSGRTRDRPPQG